MPEENGTQSPESNPTESTGLPETPPDFVEEESPEQIDNTVPTRGFSRSPMVGLGGSAGSITALQTFFEAMTPEENNWLGS